MDGRNPSAHFDLADASRATRRPLSRRHFLRSGLLTLSALAALGPAALTETVLAAATAECDPALITPPYGSIADCKRGYAMPRAADPDLVWPARGAITTYFGELGASSSRGHQGLDVANGLGSPIVAAQAGQVIVAARGGDGYGIKVVLDHGNGLTTLYGHLSQLAVAAGDPVRRGQLIGLMGSTGYSTGYHLHFEVRAAGALADPLAYLP